MVNPIPHGHIQPWQSLITYSSNNSIFLSVVVQSRNVSFLQSPYNLLQYSSGISTDYFHGMLTRLVDMQSCFIDSTVLQYALIPDLRIFKRRCRRIQNRSFVDTYTIFGFDIRCFVSGIASVLACHECRQHVCIDIN